MILHSILSRDFFIKMDLIYNFDNNINYSTLYSSELFNIKKFINSKQSLRNILPIFYPEINDKLNNSDKKYLNYELEILNLEIDNTNDIINILKQFNNYYLSDVTYINSNNYQNILDSIIDISINDKLKNDIADRIYKKFDKINKEYIYTNVNNLFEKLKFSINDLNYIENYFENLIKKLYIFFKVVGKDLSSFLSEKIVETDSFATILAKYNFYTILNIRDEIINYIENVESNIPHINTFDSLIVIFILCQNIDGKGSIVDILSFRFNHKEKLYCQRSVRYNKLQM